MSRLDSGWSADGLIRICSSPMSPSCMSIGCRRTGSLTALGSYIGRKTSVSMPHRERHRGEQIGWLRAAVLGANDGIVSTASLVAVWLRQNRRGRMCWSLVPTALSRVRCRWQPNMSLSVLKRTPNRRILTRAARARDRSTGGGGRADWHLREAGSGARARSNSRASVDREGGLGCACSRRARFTAELAAGPLQAALASAATFAVGAGVQVVTILLVPASAIVLAVAAVSLLCLVSLGATAARIGGAHMTVGRLFGVTVG
jgi:vacuolar iron transporter family protein